VRTEKELAEIKKQLSAGGLHRSPSFKILLNLSLPANVFALDKFLEIGVDGLLIDYWEFANLLYGKDFTYQQLTAITDPALGEALETVVKFSTRSSLFSGIYNLPPETENAILKKLVALGIKSVSTGTDLEPDLRRSLTRMETDLVLEKRLNKEASSHGNRAPLFS
jgi:pyruvate,water dikinase